MSLRSTLLACAALAAAAPRVHAAAPRTFDVVQFAPPDGFAIDDKSADHITMSESAPGRYGVIAVFAGRPASGDLAADFKTAWKEAVDPMMQADAAPEPQRGTMAGGAAVMAGAATGTQQGKAAYARLFVIDGGAKVVSVLVVTPNADIYDRYEDVVNATLASVKVTRTEPKAAPPPPPPPPAGAAAHKPPTPPTPPAPAYKLVPLPDDPALPDAAAIDKKDLTGDWLHATATPPDKASAVYGDLYSMTAKGKFDYRFVGKTGTDVLRENDGGGFAFKDGRLLLLFNRRGTVTYRVTGLTDGDTETDLAVLPDGFPATQGNASLFGQTWSRLKKKHGKH